MASTKKEIDYLRGIVLLMFFQLSGIATTNIDCKGKPFHCVNSTHFMICVDLGAGLSSTIDNYIIPCPPTTVCLGNNRFECEFPPPATPPSLQPIEATELFTLSEKPVTEFNISTNSPPKTTSSGVRTEYFNTVSTTTFSQNGVIGFTTPKTTVAEAKNRIQGSVKDLPVTNNNEIGLETTTNIPNITLSVVDVIDVNLDSVDEGNNSKVEKTGDYVLNNPSNVIQTVLSSRENIFESTTNDAVSTAIEFATENLQNKEVLLDNIHYNSTSPKPLTYEIVTETIEATTENLINNVLQPIFPTAISAQNSTQRHEIVTEINALNITKDLADAYQIANFDALKNPVDGKPLINEKVIYTDATTVSPETYIDTTKQLTEINTNSSTTEITIVSETESTLDETIIITNDSLIGKQEPQILKENKIIKSSTKTSITHPWNEPSIAMEPFRQFSISTPLPLSEVTTVSTNMQSLDKSTIKNQNKEELIKRFQNGSYVMNPDVDDLLRNHNQTTEYLNTSNKYTINSKSTKFSTKSHIPDVTTENISGNLIEQIYTRQNLTSSATSLTSSIATTEPSNILETGDLTTIVQNIEEPKSMLQNNSDIVSKDFIKQTELESFSFTSTFLTEETTEKNDTANVNFDTILETSTSFSTLPPSTLATTDVSNVLPTDTFTSVHTDRIATKENILVNNEQNITKRNLISLSTLFPTTEATNVLLLNASSKIEQNTKETVNIFQNDSNNEGRHLTKQIEPPNIFPSTLLPVETAEKNESGNANVTILESESFSTLPPSTFAITKASNVSPTDTFVNTDEIAHTVQNIFANSEQYITEINLKSLTTFLPTTETANILSTNVSTIIKQNTGKDNARNNLTSSTVLTSSLGRTEILNLLSSDTKMDSEQSEEPIKIFQNDSVIQNKDFIEPPELLLSKIEKDNMTTTIQDMLQLNNTKKIITTKNHQNDFADASTNFTVPYIASTSPMSFSTIKMLNYRSEPISLSSLSVVTTKSVLSTDRMASTNGTLQTNTSSKSAIQDDPSTMSTNVTATEIPSFSTLFYSTMKNESSVLNAENITEINSTPYSTFSPASYAAEDLISTDNSATATQIMAELITLQQGLLYTTTEKNDAEINVTELPLLMDSKVNSLEMDIKSTSSTKTNFTLISLPEYYSTSTSNYGSAIVSNEFEAQLPIDVNQINVNDNFDAPVNTIRDVKVKAAASSTYYKVSAATAMIGIVDNSTIQHILFDTTVSLSNQTENEVATPSALQSIISPLSEYNATNTLIKKGENITLELTSNPLENILLNTSIPSILDISNTTVKGNEYKIQLFRNENVQQNALSFVQNITEPIILPNIVERSTSLDLTTKTTSSHESNAIDNNTLETLKRTIATTKFESINDSASATILTTTAGPYESISFSEALRNNLTNTSYTSNAFVLPEKGISENSSYYPFENNLDSIKHKNTSPIIVTQLENHSKTNTTIIMSPIDSYLSNTTTASYLNTPVTHATITTDKINPDNQEPFVANVTTLTGFPNNKLVTTTDKKSNTFATVPTISVLMAETTESVNPVFDDKLTTAIPSTVLHAKFLVLWNESTSTDYTSSKQTQNNSEVNQIDRNKNDATMSLVTTDLITEQTPSIVNSTLYIYISKENDTSPSKKSILYATQTLNSEDKSNITSTSSNIPELQYPSQKHVGITSRMNLTQAFGAVKENISLPIEDATKLSTKDTTVSTIQSSSLNENTVNQNKNEKITPIVSSAGEFTTSLPFTTNKFTNGLINSNNTWATNGNGSTPIKETTRTYVNNNTIDIHGNANTNSTTAREQNDTFDYFYLEMASNTQKTVPLPLQSGNTNNTYINASNSLENKNISAKSRFVCPNNSHGRYADNENCRQFYICLGKNTPIIGRCPVDTVFSEIRKQCTKNLSHCIRNNQFYCSAEGRFSDFLSDNIYYICVKSTLGAFVRFKLQCLNGYHLNKTSVRCTLNEEISSQSESSISDNSKNISDQSASMVTEEGHGTLKTDFECKQEGKFADPTDCRKYFVCSKNKKSEYRRKIRKCDSDELFHKDKKKCVEADSVEC